MISYYFIKLMLIFATENRSNEVASNLENHRPTLEVGSLTCWDKGYQPKGAIIVERYESDC